MTRSAVTAFRVGLPIPGNKAKEACQKALFFRLSLVMIGRNDGARQVNMEVFMLQFRLRMLWAVVSVVALVLLTSACGSKGSPRVRIGVILATTGPADFLGKPERPVLAALPTAFSKT